MAGTRWAIPWAHLPTHSQEGAVPSPLGTEHLFLGTQGTGRVSCGETLFGTAYHSRESHRGRQRPTMDRQPCGSQQGRGSQQREDSRAGQQRDRAAEPANRGTGQPGVELWFQTYLLESETLRNRRKQWTQRIRKRKQTSRG